MSNTHTCLLMFCGQCWVDQAKGIFLRHSFVYKGSINKPIIHTHAPMHAQGNPSCGKIGRFFLLLKSEIKRKQQEIEQCSHKGEFETDTSALQLQHSPTPQPHCHDKQAFCLQRPHSHRRRAKSSYFSYHCRCHTTLLW